MDPEYNCIGVEIGSPISFVSKEQTCFITLHSFSPASQASYKAFSVLVSEPNPSSIILTQPDILIESSSTQDEVCFVTNFSLELSHNEAWVEISVIDLNGDKLVLITAIELALLDLLQPYHLVASSQKHSLKLSVLRSPRSLHYQSYSGLEVSLVPGITGPIDSSQCVISVEIAKLKPPPSYTPNIKFEAYSKQQAKTQTSYVTTSLAMPRAELCSAHYSFLSEAAFQFRMESHFVVVSISKYVNSSAVQWYSSTPEVIFYIELDTRTLSSLATRPLIKNVTDKVQYLKGSQLTHCFQILLRMKRKDDPFLTLSSSEESLELVPSDTISYDSQALVKAKEELERVRAERDQLSRENRSYEQRIESLQTAQHLPSFSRHSLDQSPKLVLNTTVVFNCCCCCC